MVIIPVIAATAKVYVFHKKNTFQTIIEFVLCEEDLMHYEVIICTVKGNHTGIIYLISTIKY
jgi:hypothetical protein